MSRLKGEFLELQNLMDKEGKDLEKILEEKLAPLNEKISKSHGQLIGAVTRDYQTRGCGMRHVTYDLDENFYAGIITPNTKFLTSWTTHAFMSGIKNSQSLPLSYTWGEAVFYAHKDNLFNFFGFDPMRLLQFMERPPEEPADSWEYSGGCFGGMRRTLFPTEKPRLELSVGDDESIPFLQKYLQGWQYTKLSKLINYDLPIRGEIRDRIEKEQLKVYDEVMQAEEKARSLESQKKERMKLVKDTGGIINYATHIELTDEFVEQIRFNPLMEETRRRILGSLKKAINREYNENGFQVKRRLDAGVTISIDLKEFFSQRKSMFKL